MDQGNPRVRCKDPKFMPKEKSCWSAWNGLNLPGAPAVVTYWINKLQPGACTEGKDVFVTLNPPKDSSYGFAGICGYLTLHRYIHSSANDIECRSYFCCNLQRLWMHRYYRMTMDDQEDH